MLVKYSPCTRARHGVGHDIGQAWRFESVSCPFSSARPFYRISIPAAGGMFADLLTAPCARLETSRPGHRRNNAGAPSTTLAPLALGRVSRFTSAPRCWLPSLRKATFRYAPLRLAARRQPTPQRPLQRQQQGQLQRQTFQRRPVAAIHLRYRDSRPCANRKSFASSFQETHRASRSPT